MRFLVIITSLVLGGCSYIEPLNGPTATLQLELTMIEGDLPSYPKVIYYSGSGCGDGSLVNYDLDHYYLKGNPTQDMKKNTFKDYIGYKFTANKRITLLVKDFITVEPEVRGYPKIAFCGTTIHFTAKDGLLYRLYYGPREKGCFARIVEIRNTNNGEEQVEVPNVAHKPNCFKPPNGSVFESDSESVYGYDT